jgi:hypothetical protein
MEMKAAGRYVARGLSFRCARVREGRCWGLVNVSRVPLSHQTHHTTCLPPHTSNSPQGG